MDTHDRKTWPGREALPQRECFSCPTTRRVSFLVDAVQEAVRAEQQLARIYLREGDYDLAIDLSMSTHPFVPYLLERTRVPLRMGVNDAVRLRGRFNNLNVRLKDSEDVMTRLADTLAPICRAGNA